MQMKDMITDDIHEKHFVLISLFREIMFVVINGVRDTVTGSFLRGQRKKRD